MSRFTTSRLLVATTVLSALLLPVVAQAHDQRNDATKVTDAVILPPRKLLHAGKKDSHSVLHGAKVAGESVEHGVGRLAKKIF